MRKSTYTIVRRCKRAREMRGPGRGVHSPKALRRGMSVCLYVCLSVCLFVCLYLEGSKLASERRVCWAHADIHCRMSAGACGPGAGAGGGAAGGAPSSSSAHELSFMLYIWRISSSRWLRTTYRHVAYASPYPSFIYLFPDILPGHAMRD